MAGDRVPHFSHEHPLSFEDEDKLDADDVRIKYCEICGLFMFINPSYSCSLESCSFSMHKQCADLPERTKFNFDSTYYNLILVHQKSTKKERQRCSKCGQICNNFLYSTLGRYRNSYFHPFCVSPTEIKTKHRSHHDHPMTPTLKKISAFCDACGENENDHFLSCQACNYWIHKHCALLPSIGMHDSHPNHPLILLYSNPFSKQNSSWGNCEICEQDIPIENAVYMCQACLYFVHLKCVKLEIKALTQEESRKQIIDLPPGEEEYEVFPTLLIHDEVQGFNGDENNAIITKRMTPEECHKTHNHYSLIFHGKDDHDHEISGGVCNACVRPISTPYYSCSSTETGCRFLVHELCAKLSKTIPRKFHDYRSMHLFTEWPSEFFNAFYCDICYRRCNGFGYSDDEKPTPWSSVIADVECASAPRIIKHQSHQHFLHLMKCEDFDNTPQVMCCQLWKSKRFLYMCISCDFKIHIACALLPKIVSHEFDNHPLQLVTDPSKNLNIRSSDYKLQNHDYFCEFCEEDIDLNFWLYKCAECDQSFHVNCIPSVGEFSKYKFGGTIGRVSRSHPHSDHPLTSVRMLTVATQTCGICKGRIHGFQDNVAFQCSTCDFWIHGYCAEDEDPEDED